MVDAQDDGGKLLGPHSALLKRLVEALQRAGYSARTEQAYVAWARRFLSFHRVTRGDTARLDDEHVEAFLKHLCEEERLAVPTLHQALAAVLVFLARVLGREVEDRGSVTRALLSPRLPLVLGAGEVVRLLGHMRGTTKLMAALLYGSGLRVHECVQLRTADVEFERGLLFVRATRSREERSVPLVRWLVPELRTHLRTIHAQYQRDAQRATEWVELQESSGRTPPREGEDWSDQWLFPAAAFQLDPISRRLKRHHVHEMAVQAALERAALGAGLPDRTNCHTLRHSFAVHLLQAGHGVRSVRALMGHGSLATTMIYAHVIHSRRRSSTD